MATLHFLGAAGTVTGSRHLLEFRGWKFLFDCGLFQGRKELRERNRSPFPVAPSDISAVFLTHAHIDHTGYLPRLVRDGFKGRVYCTRATAELCALLLPDSARLQEEEAAWANKRGYSKHRPALPLYTEQEAMNALKHLEPIEYGDDVFPCSDLRVKFRDAGHILGSAHVDVRSGSAESGRKIVFGGDLGRPRDPLLKDPVQPYEVDYLVLESTYGDRLHGGGDVCDELVRVITETAARGGTVVVPSFAVGRTQMLLHLLRQLEEAGRIPRLPVFIDSPMAVGALKVFEERVKDLNLGVRVEAVRGVNLFRTANLTLCETTEQSKRINNAKGPAIIISASGMVTGGRILHHLARLMPSPENTVLFVGYQGEGTRGRKILDGSPDVKIHGEQVPIRCKVEYIPGFSGHADYEEIEAWLMGFSRKPEHTWLVHGEGGASAALAQRLRSRLHWKVDIAEEGKPVALRL
jgi:metallo-beta-lactamase family protein